MDDCKRIREFSVQYKNNYGSRCQRNDLREG
jgi:hypothetical protein